MYHLVTLPWLQAHICAGVSASAVTSTETTSSLAVATAPQDGVCVVRLSVINEPPTFDIPLLLGPMLRVSCTAVAVSHSSGRNYLVTTASSVAYSTKVQVHHPGRVRPFSARVSVLAMDLELALLVLEDEQTFWETPGLTAVPVGPAASPGLAVQILWPKATTDQAQPQGSSGSSSPSATTATPASQTAAVGRTLCNVSCVEAASYPATFSRLSALLIPTALRKDAVGAAVMSTRGELLGLVYRCTRRKKKTERRLDMCWAIPAAMVGRLLDEVHLQGKHQGVPGLGIRWKRLEAEALRSYLGLGKGQTGVLIQSVNQVSSSASKLMLGDVITSINGFGIGNDGTLRGPSAALDGPTPTLPQPPSSAPTADPHAASATARDESQAGLDLDPDAEESGPSGSSGSHSSSSGSSGRGTHEAAAGSPDGGPGSPASSGKDDDGDLAETDGGGEDALCSDGQATDGEGDAPSEGDLQASGTGVGAAAAAAAAAHGMLLTQFMALQQVGSSLQLGLFRAGAALEVNIKYSAAVYIVPPSKEVQHHRITCFNGTPVVSLRQLAGLVLSCTASEMRFELEGKTLLVLDTEEARQDTRQVLTEFDITSAVSPDLADLLPKRRSLPAGRRNARQSA
ncbi:MAG: hypothetical protein WDW38_008508 [Sanguina aurantia]